MDVKKYEDARGSYAVRATLTDPKGNKVKEMLSDRFTMDGKGKKSVELSSQVSNPDKWTCETPVLYGLKLELLNESGTVMQEIDSKMGFKEMGPEEKKDGIRYTPMKLEF